MSKCYDIKPISEQYLIEEIAETFINGNISDARKAIGGNIKRFIAVQKVLQDSYSKEIESFNRLMSLEATLF